jgi:hypothetical protein
MLLKHSNCLREGNAKGSEHNLVAIHSPALQTGAPEENAMRLSLAICILSFLSGVAQAESDTNNFLRDYDASPTAKKSLMSSGLSQLESGMSWANVFLVEGRKEQPIYCPPNTLTLTGDQLVSLLRRQLEKYPDEGSRPVGLVLMYGLQREFACQPQSK